jgi:nitroreductase
MDTFDAIYQRRAIKQFDPDHRLTKEEETKLLDAAIQAPTSLIKNFGYQGSILGGLFFNVAATDETKMAVSYGPVDSGAG